MKDPKGIMLAVLAKAKEKMPKKEMEMEDEYSEEPSEDMDSEIIGDEILSAIQNNDPAGLVEAIKSLIEMID